MKDINQILNSFETHGIVKEGNGLKYVLDFQDFVGMKSMKDILTWYSSLDKPTRKTFIWAAGCCLSQDTFIEITKHVVCNAVISEVETSLMDEHESRMVAIVEREEAMTLLETENINMKETIAALREVRSCQEKTISSLAEKAQAYDTIKKALFL